MSRGDLWASFGGDWPPVGTGGFAAAEGWIRVGEVPTGAGVESSFWGAVQLQQVGGSRSQWKAHVDFYADILLDSPAIDRLDPEDSSTADPAWLGLDASSGAAQLLLVTSAEVRRAHPRHRFERHPGVRRLPNSTLLG